jgi:hypothetical protein
MLCSFNSFLSLLWLLLYFFITKSVQNYVIDDTRDDSSISDDDPEGSPDDSVDSDSDVRDQEWLDNYFDRLVKKRKCAWPIQGSGLRSSVMVWMMILMSLMTR